MKQDQEIWRLSGEGMAIQSILVGLLAGLVDSGEQGRALAEHAFGYAETVAQVGSLKLGSDYPREHLAAFLGVVEQLREATLGSHGEPKGGI